MFLEAVPHDTERSGYVSKPSRRAGGFQVAASSSTPPHPAPLAGRGLRIRCYFLADGLRIRFAELTGTVNHRSTGSQCQAFSFPFSAAKVYSAPRCCRSLTGGSREIFSLLNDLLDATGSIDMPREDSDMMCLGWLGVGGKIRFRGAFSRLFMDPHVIPSGNYIGG